MAKTREVFICSACGAQTLQWRGQCPGCHEWNTLQAAAQPKALSRSNTRVSVPAGNRPVPLQDVAETGHHPYPSGIASLDRVLGKGLVPGAAILIGGEPGIGKSTLLLQVAGLVAAQGGRVLYASGEESLPQIKARGQRLGMLHDNLLAMSTSSVDEVIAALELAPSRLLVVDSVQTMSSVDAEGLPGNVNQVRAVSMALLEACRRTVISLEGDRRQMFRLLRVFKNRFGPNEELLVFRMGGRGMEVVDDPSTFFLGDRDASLSGTAVVMAVDGQRPLAVEVQALVARTFLSIPRRAALGFDANRLHLLLAVLEKRLKLNFGQVDIYAKVGGGMKLQEPGLDLALVAAVLSSYYDVPLPEKCVLWGEVDLNGQVRPVAAHDLRLAQARRLGFEPVIHPGKGGIATIADLQQKLFHRKQ